MAAVADARRCASDPGRAAADRRRRAITAAKRGIPVSLCGDAGGDPAMHPGSACAPACAICRWRRRSVGRAKAAIAGGRPCRAIAMAERVQPLPSDADRTAAIRAYKAMLRGRSTSARPARASASPTRSARTAASSRRSPARPIRRRSPRSTCRRSSRSAISRPPERERFLAAYARGASRPAASGSTAVPRVRGTCTLPVPDLGDDRQNARSTSAIARFRRRIAPAWPRNDRRPQAAQGEETMKKLINAVDTVLDRKPRRLRRRACRHRDARRRAQVRPPQDR